MGPDLSILLVVHAIRQRDNIRIISARKGNRTQTKQYCKGLTLTDDFSKAKRGAIARTDSGKVRITIRLDAEIINHFKRLVLESGGGNYQTLMNDATALHSRHGSAAREAPAAYHPRRNEEGRLVSGRAHR